MKRERTTVANVLDRLAALKPKDQITAVIDGPVKGLWMNKRTTVASVTRLLGEFEPDVTIEAGFDPELPRAK